MPAEAVADEWEFPIAVKKTLDLRATIMAPAASASVLPIIAGGVKANLRQTLIVTINGATYEWPGIMSSFQHGWSDGQIQTYEVEWKCASPDAGDMPTTPAGTTTLIEKAFNTLAVLAYQFDADAAGASAPRYSGNLIFESMRVGFSGGQVLETEFETRSQGAITIANIA